jgi:ABC-type cobalamin/Fe3+-siderophores transport system ATPase subunit
MSRSRVPPRAKLPPQLVVPYDSSDKKLKEKWTKERAKDLANIPSPFRMLLLGPPGGGKSCVIKNLVIHQRPRFKEVYVIHEDHSADPEAPGTTEYDDLDPTLMMSEVPDLRFWNAVCAEDDEDGPPVKRLVILDDLEMKGADRLKNLQTLFRYVSSHKGFSLMLAFQNFYGLEPVIKKCANVYVIWRPRDRDEIGRIEKSVGLEKGILKEIFNTVAHDEHDSIMIDRTSRSPAPLRLNVFEVIEFSDDVEGGT